MENFREKLTSVSEKYSIYIEYLDETTSTNDIASDGRFRNGDIVIAEFQTHGRGQRGHTWESCKGENLMLTVVLEPQRLPAELQFYISKIIPLALVKTLEHYGTPAKIKWTNDVYVGDKKIAGILIENDIMGAYVIRSLAGIGININQSSFESSLPNPVSMFQISGRKYDRAEVLGKFIGHLSVYYENVNNGCLTAIDTDYRSNLYRKDEVHSYLLSDGTVFKATLRDVKETGELLLEHSDGTLNSYLFRDVEFII
ncbi:MAG: biotin--[acetyl-CoA-carboxylase] ligase [Rikenellaceae bacterium]|nr:biotin--[acetyl-CoA-carboxylase] ligase [Rikenellaceae bacterium]